MNEDIFKQRTKRLALRVIRMTESLPTTGAAYVIGKQIVRSSTSVGANYRSACRARSVAAMIAKLDIVLEEADETLYWLELVVDVGLLPDERLVDLKRETSEIIAMVVASLKTLRAKHAHRQ